MAGPASFPALETGEDNAAGNPAVGSHAAVPVDPVDLVVPVDPVDLVVPVDPVDPVVPVVPVVPVAGSLVA